MHTQQKMKVNNIDNPLFFTTTKPYLTSTNRPIPHKLFNYQSLKSLRGGSTTFRKSKQSSSIKNAQSSININNLRTLLGGISQLRNCSQSIKDQNNGNSNNNAINFNINFNHVKSKNKNKNVFNQTFSKDFMIKSIDCGDFNCEQLCQINIRDNNGNNTGHLYYKTSTNDKLFQFLKQKHPKVQAWKCYPENISLDYYLSLKNKDITFLNGQSLTLQPYKLQKQKQITLNSFDILYCIGTGGFSKVFLCKFKENGKFYAMKVIDKNFIIKNKKKNIVMNQKKIMEKLKHPFIIEMKFSFQTKDSLIFVLELCPGGELFGLVKKFRIMNQGVAKFYMVEILLGLEQIHKNNVVYRDFKPENILIDMDGHVRIADFGLAKPGIQSFKNKAYSFCGSPEYMPPQMILKKGHSLPVDFYCLGALLYQLVTGLPPFYSQDPNQIYQGTLSQTLTFPSHAKLSNQLKDLLKTLLQKDQQKRLGTTNGVNQVMGHPWFKKVNSQAYLQKQAEPPVRFTGIKDLKLIFSEMKIKNQQYIQNIRNQQLNQQLCTYDLVMDKFYFDYRETGKLRLSCRNKKQNSFSSLSLKSNRQSTKAIKIREKSLKNMFSQRSLTSSNKTGRNSKPMTARNLNLHLYIR